MGGRDETRSRILETAGRIFAEKGFQGTTVREICSTADVNLASVNYHFGDKQRLYIEALKNAIRLRRAQVSLPVWSEGTHPSQKLRDFVRTLLTRMLGVSSTPWQSRLVMREVFKPSEACREMVRDCFRPEFELLCGLIEQLLPAGASAVEIHQSAFGVVGQCLYYRTSSEVVCTLVGDAEYEEHYGVGRLAEHISRTTLAALRASTVDAKSDQSQIDMLS
ncbi:MAG: transcriptional regulator [Planctomycetaceae bacterium]|nr:transcriptional regulator [Planctomycetaceae bacterium]